MAREKKVSVKEESVAESVKSSIPSGFKAAVLTACAMLSQYQRLLESQGKANEAKRVKDVKDTLWKQCQENDN